MIATADNHTCNSFKCEVSKYKNYKTRHYKHNSVNKKVCLYKSHGAFADYNDDVGDEDDDTKLLINA